MRRRWGGAVALVALAAGCSSGNQPSPAAPDTGTTRAPGVAPLRLARGEFLCPPGSSFAVYRGRVYPPNHPRYQELTGRPERCFASLDEASRGGYDLAPPPPGDRVIGGVYLEPAGLPLETRCRAAAVKLGLAVPCPTLIPSSATQQLNFGHGTFVIEVDFSGPPGYVGIEGSPGNHLFVQAYAHARRFFRDPCLNPANSTPGPVVHGATTGFIDCPEGSSMNSGHAVLVWQRSDVLYAVSVHGHTAVNRRIDLAIARGLRLLRPGKA